MYGQSQDLPDLAAPRLAPSWGVALLLFASGALLWGAGYMPALAEAHLLFVSVGLGMVAVGALAGVLRMLAGAHGARAGRAFRVLYGTAPDPAALTDESGRVIAINGAMRQAARAGMPRTIENYLRRWTDDPDRSVHRLARAALAQGEAVEVLDPANGGMMRLQATALGADRVVWRVSSLPAPAAAEGPDYRGAPFLHAALDAGGRITALSRPLAGPEGPGPRRLEDLLADPPLRPGGVHEIRGLAEPMRCLSLALADRGRDLFFFPVDPAEAQGVAPDRFLDHLPVGLVRTTTAGELIFANRAAKALLGERALPGAFLGDLVEGLGRSIPDRLMDVTRGRSVGRSEIARSKGEERDLFLQVALNRVVFGGDISVIAVISDATEMKALEAQFVQSQKMQAVGQLAGGVAHDFNNLLTAINGHCDLLLLRHEFGDTDHGDLLQIRQNANRAAALVRQLLAFSRKQTLRPKVLHLAETLSELSHLLNRLLGEKVVLRIENGPDLGPVRVDERQFEQVIMNLAVNARDAMPNGGEVRIGTRNLSLAQDIERDQATIPAGEYVQVEVSDTGSGIPEDKLHKIFEPFYTTKKLGEGTGLGLSTVYGIVKQTGGFIFVTSKVGRGSTFSIYLPRYDEEAAPEPVAETGPPTTRDLTGHGTVLLVEDEAPVRSFAARALRLRGYTVIEAGSGEEALEITADPSQRIDLLVSDVVMPGIDGPTWVREAREQRPDVKVIFVSGYAEDVFKEEGGTIDDAAFLPKPFSLNDLTQRVKEVLEAP
ncbi:MAG TPA: ATP-binding protein [Paracoccaceae bacterium]|nr:ATP-binding protein [Paracoccaceae bacterium]